MNYYKGYGLTWKSEVALDALIKIEAPSEVDIEVVFGQSPAYVLEDHASTKKNYGKHGDLFWFKNKFALFTIKDGKKITIDTEGYTHTTILFLLGYCVSVIYYQRNRMAIHGSAIIYREHTMILAGHSKAGKSSLTSKFLDNGAQLLVDDISIIEVKDNKCQVHQGFPYQNLCKDLMERNGYDFSIAPEIDRGREKYRYPRKEQFCDQLSDIDYMFYLGVHNEADVKLVALNPSERLRMVAEHLFIRKIIDKVGLKDWLMKDCLALANNVQAFRLSRPEEGMTLDEQMGRIVDLID